METIQLFSEIAYNLKLKELTKKVSEPPIKDRVKVIQLVANNEDIEFGRDSSPLKSKGVFSPLSQNENEV